MLRLTALCCTPSVIHRKHSELSLVSSCVVHSHLFAVKKIDQLRGSLHGLSHTLPDDADNDDADDDDARVKRAKHTVFVDDERELEAFDPVQHFDTVPEAVNRTYNRPRKQALAAAPLASTAGVSAEATATLRARRYEELRQRGERLHKIDRLKQVLELRKHLKGKGRRRKVVAKADSPNGVAVYKWAKERKK